MKNILTIDVEDYFQVENFKKVIKFSDWGKYEDRVVGNTGKMLEILDNAGVKATFFVLGWTAEKFPGIVSDISEAGHEVASHGYAHAPIYTLSPAEFRADIVKAKKILEGITGRPVLGYRAPTFSLTDKCLWAVEVLAEEGFEYDSSVLPVRHKTRGLPDAGRYPYRIVENGRSLFEVPISTTTFLGRNMAFSGGGYFRLFPYTYVKNRIKKINTDRHPAVVYMHPWEIDPDQPRIKADIAGRFKHYVNISKTEKKMKRLLDDFEFGSIESVYCSEERDPRLRGDDTLGVSSNDGKQSKG